MARIPAPSLSARGLPSGGGSLVAGAFFAIILWQLLEGGAGIFREIAAASMDERKLALRASEAERIEGSVLPWLEIYRAIQERVPDDAVLAVAGNFDRDAFELFFRTAVLCYPRRLVAVTRPPTPAEIEAVGRALATMSRPVFVADLRSGFPLPPAAERVMSGTGFTLWRLR